MSSTFHDLVDVYNMPPLGSGKEYECSISCAGGGVDCFPGLVILMMSLNCHLERGSDQGGIVQRFDLCAL